MPSRKAVADLVTMLATAFGEVIERKFPSEEWYGHLHTELFGFEDEDLAGAARALLRKRAKIWETDNAFAIIIEACTAARKDRRREERARLEREEQARKKWELQGVTPEVAAANRERFGRLARALNHGTPDDVRRVGEEIRQEIEAGAPVPQLPEGLDE